MADKRLSGWKLCSEAGKRGVPVSHAQFRGYCRWGLIPDPEDGGWSPDVVDRLVQIRKLEEKVRPLWRRAILLHTRYYPVAPVSLRKAMLRMLPTIKAPKRKMRYIDAAIRWESRKLEDPAYAGMVRPVRANPTDDFMEPRRWKEVLERSDIDDALFGEHASTMCYFAIGLKRATADTRLKISMIPDEEVITLLTIRQLAGLAVGIGRPYATECGPATAHQ